MTITLNDAGIAIPIVGFLAAAAMALAVEPYLRALAPLILMAAGVASSACLRALGPGGAR